MKKNTKYLSILYCYSLQQNIIYSLHPATILTHTIACSHIFFSEIKHWYSQKDLRSQINSPYNIKGAEVPNYWRQFIKFNQESCKQLIKCGLSEQFLFSLWLVFLKHVYILNYELPSDWIVSPLCKQITPEKKKKQYRFISGGNKRRILTLCAMIPSLSSSARRLINSSSFSLCFLLAFVQLSCKL